MDSVRSKGGRREKKTKIREDKKLANIALGGMNEPKLKNVIEHLAWV